jgi:hypothetical protein
MKLFRASRNNTNFFVQFMVLLQHG